MDQDNLLQTFHVLNAFSFIILKIPTNKLKEDSFWVKAEENKFEDDFIFQSLVENFSVKKREFNEWFSMLYHEEKKIQSMQLSNDNNYVWFFKDWLSKFKVHIYIFTAVKKDAQVEVANEKKGKKVKDLRVLDPKSAMNLCKLWDFIRLRNSSYSFTCYSDG